MRSCLLFVSFAILAGAVSGVGVAQTLDIPASEAAEENAVSELDTVLQPAHKSEKTDKDASKSAAVTSDKSDDKSEESNVVVLRGLNKVIGRVSTLEVPLGTLANFENLEIIARKCWKAPPEDRPENAALLEVREVKSGEAPKQIFLGWMMSSSPAISSLEHPVYDITVLSCEYKKNLETN